jgi:Dolichyl-phosphate-mannose-protein mannosyltransferase
LANPLPTAERETLRVEKPAVTPASEGLRSRLGGIDFALLPVLVLPLLLLRLDDTWLFAYSAGEQGFIDTWLYFGYFLDFTHHLRTFRSGYVAGRLPWVLPGVFAYHFFPPIVAACVLHVVFFWVALVSLYLILKHTVGRRAALLSAFLMGCYSYFLWAIGWDYVDGATISYMLLTLCLLTYAAKAVRPQRWLVLSGAAFALAIYTHLFVISFVPAFALYYFFARREHGAEWPAPSRRLLLRGFLAVTVLFAVLNVVLRAAPLFFLVPALSRASRFVGTGNRWFDSSYGWLASAFWLLLPGVAALGAFLSVNLSERPRTWRGFRFFWQLHLAVCAFIMLMWQLSGQPVLQLPFVYTSLLIPAVFLALGAQVASSLERLRSSQFAILLIAAAAILLSPFAVPLNSQVIATIEQHRWLWPAGLGIAAVVLLARQFRYTGALAVLLLCASVATLTATTGTRTWGHPGAPDDPRLQKQAFLAIVDSVHAVQQIDPTDHLFFWYDFRAPLGPLHRSVSSTFMWWHRLVSETFPSLDVLTGPPYPTYKPLQPHLKIAILSVDEDALQRADDTLRKVGLTARFISQRRISEGPISWNMIVIETEKAE